MSDHLLFDFTVVTVDALGKTSDRVISSAQQQIEILEAGVELEMVAIPGGRFTMGTTVCEPSATQAQIPQHEVTIAPFWLGKYPVTVAQWIAVAALPKVDRSLDPELAEGKGHQFPIEQVSWFAAIEFCARLAQHTGRAYRLPSEAEWEYACRAGTTTPFHFGATITADLANYSGVDWEYMGKICSRGSYGSGPQGDDRRQSTPVGAFQVANAFGLYDMHGTVREWCADVWHPNYAGAPSDGSAWMSGGEPHKRVLRGGSWNTGPANCRSAFRGRHEADLSLYDIGFRVACD